MFFRVADDAGSFAVQDKNIKSIVGSAGRGKM
jgi:hypothetical protein